MSAAEANKNAQLINTSCYC